MTTFLDRMISPIPIKIVDLKADRSKLVIGSLFVITYGHLPGRTSKRRARSDVWALTYITRGKGSFQISAGPEQQIEAGNLFWEWPGETFYYGPDSGSTWDEYYLCFEGDRIQEWTRNGMLTPGAILDIGLDPVWTVKMADIGTLLESGLPVDADRAALLLEAFIFELHQTSTNPLSLHNPSIQKETIRVVMEDISKNVYGVWNETEVWTRNNISRSTLRRIVRHNTGYPLNDYITRLKIAEAKKLLSHTDLLIYEIANMLGYDEVTYFSRLFKKYAGITAHSFRKLKREGVLENREGHPYHLPSSSDKLT